ncbi:hypothetical protein Tco_0400763, partial [Tanacetum coccineum]
MSAFAPSLREDSSHLFLIARLATGYRSARMPLWNLSTGRPLVFNMQIAKLVSNSTRNNVSKVKDLLEGVLYITWWSVWMFRNQLLFSSKAPRKDVIFDDIVSRSFTWSSVNLLKEIKDLLKKNPTRQRLFRRTVFGSWLDILSHDSDNHLMHYVLHHQSLELLGVLRHTETWIGLSDMNAVRVCLLLVAELVFMGKEDRNCIPRHLVSLVEDFDCWNDYPWGEYIWVKFYKRTVNVAAKHKAFHLDKKKQNPDYYPTHNLYDFPLAFKIWILESYPNSRKWWSKKDNVLPRALAWSNVTKFGKNDYNGLLGPDSNPNLELYATPVEQQTEWFKASIEYINGLVNLDMNVSKDDIGGDGFVDSVGGDKNHECNQDKQDKQDQQDKQPSLADVLHELRALRKESTCSCHVVDNLEVACAGTGIHNTARNNDSQNSNHNAVNTGLSCLANDHMLLVLVLGIQNPSDNDSRNSNHNAVNTRLSCSANDHMSSCFSPEMPNDEVVIASTAIHNADEMYDSPNCVTDNDVNERIGVSSNYPMPDGHNDNQMGIMIQSNSSGHEIPNVVVVVACMGIDKPDGHNDNPNANDNDVNKVIDPMSTCSGVDTHLAEVAVAGMEFDKGDGHIDIPTASGNDVNLAKSVSVNDLMVLAICSMRFQNEVALNAVCEGNVVSAKEVGLDVLIQVACDGMGIDKADGYSQHEPSTLNALIEGFDSQNNNPGIDFLQHDDHVDFSVAKPNDHPTVDIGVNPVHENEFVDDFIDVLNDEESLPKVSLDDMNVDAQEEKL